MKTSLIFVVLSLLLPILGITQTVCAQLNSDKQSDRLTARNNINQSFEGNVIDRVESNGSRIRNFVDEPSTAEDSSKTNRSVNRVVVMDDDGETAASDGESIVRGNDNEVTVKRNIEIMMDGRLNRTPPFPNTDDRGIRVNQQNIIIPSH
jgi:signal transduction histidine kinase